MKTSYRSKQGSALLTTLLVTAGLMVMLASYHSLVMSNLRASHRSYHGSAAINLAETGLEEAMWAINQKRARNTAAYSGWTVVGDVATREYRDTFSVGTSAGTYVKVKITNCNLTLPAKPTIKAQSILSLPNGMPPVEKWLEITLDAPSSGTPGQDGPPAIGFVAKEDFKFNGNNPKVDSWNSDPNKTGGMTHRYSSTTMDDQGFVGSTAISVDTITVSNADIKGYVATYQDANLSNNVGPNGSILADDSPAGTKIDSRRVSTDFKAVLPDVGEPSISSSLPPVTGTRFPGATDVPVIDPTTNKLTYFYRMNGLSSSIEIVNKINASTGAEIPSNVVVIVPYPHSINLTGSDGISIKTGANLQIYAGGNVTIAGNGVANGTVTNTSTGLTETDMQQPSSFKLWGTATSSQSQTIKVAGNGALSGVIYAPNADITFTGHTPKIFGAATGKTMTISGNAEVHYDSALGQNAFGTPADSGHSSLTISLWRELLAQSEKAF